MPGGRSVVSSKEPRAPAFIKRIDRWLRIVARYAFAAYDRMIASPERRREDDWQEMEKKFMKHSLNSPLPPGLL
jgi:hypothetical protein